MRLWTPAQWALRTRVALAFLAATAVAFTVFGVFVQLRVSDALADRLRDAVSAEAGRFSALPRGDRLAAVTALGGEVHAQVLSTKGEVLASSTLVTDPLIRVADGETESEVSGWREQTVTLIDDDAAAFGRDQREREEVVMLVGPVDEGFLVVGTSREDSNEALIALRNQLLVAGPLAVAVAGGLGYVVAGAGLRPIEGMRAQAATISARTAGERLPVPAADDELRRLALTLNGMIERLDEGLQRERTFVAEASHDLRTPLSLMLTEVELALGEPRTHEELTSALRSIEDEVRRLIVLAQDLLERAGSDNAGLSIESHRIDLTDLARRVVERFRPAAGDRVISVAATRPVEVEGDAVRLDRAVSNLIDNALRHGTGDVEVGLQSEAGKVILTVTDQGHGLSHDGSSLPGGPGLGLTIVREIARAHGGTVDLARVDGGTQARLEVAAPTSR